MRQTRDKKKPRETFPLIKHPNKICRHFFSNFFLVYLKYVNFVRINTSEIYITNTNKKFSKIICQLYREIEWLVACTFFFGKFIVNLLIIFYIYLGLTIRTGNSHGPGMSQHVRSPHGFLFSKILVINQIISYN
jgi:hypothetical protein